MLAPLARSLHALPIATAQPRLFVRTWRRSCPIRPRHSRLRRFGTLGLLLGLTLLVAGYVFVTDSDRVRAQAEGYLSRLIGGDVTVEEATLGLFEGLRLEGVTISTPGDRGVDSVVFTARSVEIDYDPLALLAGRIRAQQIIATDPHLRLVENLSTGEFNFARLSPLRRSSTEPTKFKPPEELPVLRLRNAQLDYAHRIGDRIVAPSSVGIEASLKPRVASPGSTVGARMNDPLALLEPTGAYDFDIYTLGLATEDDELGPRARGTIYLGEGGPRAPAGALASIDAQLSGVDFAALRDVLPERAAEWARRHDITGRLEVPAIRAALVPDADNPGGTTPRFNVSVQLAEARMRAFPEQWLPPEEVFVRTRGHAWLDRVANTGRAWGMDLPESLQILARRSSDSLELVPLRLNNVSGRFVFDERTVSIQNLVGSIEGNRLRVDGLVDGYDENASLNLVVSSAGEALRLPPKLQYLSSLPRPVREIYNRFSPRGTCEVRLELHRPPPVNGRPSRPTITGRIDVLDGMFTLDRFPYPVRNARGSILLRHATSELASQALPGLEPFGDHDQLILEDLRGNGIMGGPNADAAIVINGLVAPLNSVAGFDITITGENVHDERALLSSLPPPVQRVINAFDPAVHGKGVGLGGGPAPDLDFRGGFIARILRPAGRDKRWDFNVDLMLTDVSGALQVFPYPLTHAAAEVSVRRDGLTVKRATMQRPVAAENAAGGQATTASVDLRGTLDWSRPEGMPRETRPPLRYDLRLTGDGIPADAPLNAALDAAMPDVAQTLKSLGFGGEADVTARLENDFAEQGDPNFKTKLDYDLVLDVRGGRFWPDVSTFSLTELVGRIAVRPGVVTLRRVVGKRGEGDVIVNGTVGFGEAAMTDLSIEASDLPLDGGLYDLLPPVAQDAWDWVRPSGSTDGTVAYQGPTAALVGEAFDPEAIKYDVTLRPAGIDALPLGVPYRVQNVRGEINLVPGTVTIRQLTAEHAVDNLGVQPAREPVKIALSGTGDLTGEEPAGLWTLAATVDDAPVDDELRAALPAALAEMMTSLEVDGRLSADFELLRIRTREGTSGGEALPPDVAFKGAVETRGASMNVGVQLDEVVGVVDLAGTYEDGQLHELSGALEGKTFLISGRPGEQLTGNILLAPGGDVLSIDKLRGRVAGGSIDGGVSITFEEEEPGVEPTQVYTVGISVREADVKKLLGDTENVGGQLTARLDLTGEFGDQASRRGRGTVLVDGDKLYELPLVLGLLQVTNLALPIAEPFTEATSAFAIDGSRVVFDSIELKAGRGEGNPAMRMQGSGWLDFESEKLSLTFTTSNHGWASIPLVGDLVGMARNELLRLNVRGTLEKPEVSGSTLPTVTGTIDEVLRGD